MSLLLAAALQAAACSPAQVAEALAPVDTPHALTCSLTLSPGQAIMRPLRLEGEAASGVTVDCGGGAIGRPGAVSEARAPTVAIVSRSESRRWSRPADIVIRNCVIHGSVRLWGLGTNQAAALMASSRTPNHTAFAQQVAPTRIRIEGVTLQANGAVPLYVGPGVTEVSVADSRFRGRAVSTAVYLDAESADNRIEGSDFDLRVGREVIAVDGSARNRIAGNRFALGNSGGVFLYRNCGEDGVVRHQTPSDNQVTDNEFHLRTWVWPWTRLWPRAVVVGSREGSRSYCPDDAGWPFGSSIDDGDRATGNAVARNVIRQ